MVTKLMHCPTSHRIANLKGKQFTEALKEVIPRQQFDVAIQAAIGSNIKTN